MTDAGWTANKPIKAGWYWWRFREGKDPVVMKIGDDHIAKTNVFTIGTSVLLIDELPGEWLGPITPTDRQQGRVEGLREAERIARNHKGGYTLDVFTAKLIADPDGPWTLGSDIAEKLAQAAQDEKPTKEDL